MADENGDVEIPFGDNPRETAVLLLAAAEDLDLAPAVVRTTSYASFLVSTEIADKAGLNPDKPAPKAAKKTAQK